MGVPRRAPGSGFSLRDATTDPPELSGSVSFHVTSPPSGTPAVRFAVSSFAVGACVNTAGRQAENSEVLPAGSVAVAVRIVPGAVAGKVCENVAFPDASVVAVSEPSHLRWKSRRVSCVTSDPPGWVVRRRGGAKAQGRLQRLNGMERKPSSQQHRTARIRPETI